MKDKLAKQIAINLKKALADYKKKRGFTTNKMGKVSNNTDRCPCCKQLMPNPYTQEWLAIETGVGKMTIAHYFQGKRPPSIPRLMKIATVLEVSINDLLDGVG
jgi:transcriptional regulator with XRE-family HTH domain